MEPTTLTATEAKNEFGRILETVLQGGLVIITKHDAPKAVVMSMAEFNELSRAGDTRLDTLGGEFDDMLARMQTPNARAAARRAFAATPAQLGKAAVAASHAEALQRRVSRADVPRKQARRTRARG